MKALLLLALLVSPVLSSRILCFFPTLSRSHVLTTLVIADELAARGHEVTVVTITKMSTEESKFREIVIPTKVWDPKLFKFLLKGEVDNFYLIKTAGKLFHEVSEDVVKSKRFQTLMREETFDLAFFIGVYYNLVQIGVADQLKVPYIIYSPNGAIHNIEEYIGQHFYPATVPSKYYEVAPTMNICRRTINFLYYLAELGFGRYFDYVLASSYAKIFPNNTRSFHEMKRNVSLILHNEHITESFVARPMLPNEIEIGGVQIKEEPEPLTQEVQDWLDGAEEGAIVWTFGSNLPISMIDEDKVQAMFKVLSGLKQRVLLKWEKDPKELPSNFKGLKWIQQDSALAHPNVRLFFAHGGHGGINEALYYKVPVFGIPFFSDQSANLKKAERDGWALQMELKDVTEKTFEKAIKELLFNEKYQNRVNELSEMFKDRITTPKETAVYWIEYVLRYHGAPHLSYEGRNLNLVQLYCLDVLAVFLLLALIPVFAVKWLVRRLRGAPVPEKKHKTD